MKGWQIGLAIVVLAAAVGAGMYFFRCAAPAAQQGSAAAQAGSETDKKAEPAGKADTKSLALDLMKKGVAYLKKNQRPDGSWGQFQPGVGITALVLHSMMVSPLGLTPENTPEIKKGLDYILKHAQPSGEINEPGAGLSNYRTALALLALKSADHGKYDKVIKKAQEFLKTLQHHEKDGIDKSNPKYGGFGYGKRKRPDLSNTQWAIEALAETGLSKDDPAFKRALVFLHRVQNSSEVNDQPWAAVVNDGGGVYTPAPAPNDPSDVISKAGKVEKNGFVGWRSYGMTYAMLKSYLYLGLDQDSPEVKMAYNWIRDNWTVKVNPGMPKEQELQGKFYYLTTLAKTMNLLGKPSIVTSDGKTHYWANELVSHLAEIQNQDGSLVNKADRWFEGDKTLVTAYVLRALSFAWPYIVEK